MAKENKKKIFVIILILCVIVGIPILFFVYGRKEERKGEEEGEEESKKKSVQLQSGRPVVPGQLACMKEKCKGAVFQSDPTPGTRRGGNPDCTLSGTGFHPVPDSMIHWNNWDLSTIKRNCCSDQANCPGALHLPPKW